MVSPFQRLTIDGRNLQGPEIMAWCDAFTQARPDGDWAWDLAGTLGELVNGDGSLHAKTSGTTGPAKPITILPNDLIASAKLTERTFRLKAGDRTLHCLPCSFVAGKLMLVRAFVTRLDLHIADPRGSVLNNLGTGDRFRFAAMVPQQLHRAIQEDRARVETQFETILLGGGPVSNALIEDLQGLRTNVFHGYGSTETVTHVALRTLNGPERSDHFTTLGKITCSIDKRGCLVIRTPHLSTTDHITNDIAELIDSTHFRWLGRYDNVILSGGLKIFPEQLEVRSAGVIPYPHYFTAMPDDALGQCVTLVLETDGIAQEVVPEVMEKLTAVLEKHELPRRVRAVLRLSRTSGGKIIRSRTDTLGH